MEHATICSLHFEPDAYQRDLKAELLNLPDKRLLKEDAVPTLHLNASPNKTTGLGAPLDENTAPENGNRDTKEVKVSDRGNRLQKRSILKSALETLAKLPPRELKRDASTMTERVVVSSILEDLESKKTTQALQRKCRRFKARNQKLQRINSTLYHKLQQAKRQNSELQKKFRSQTQQSLNGMFYEKLRNIFTHSQIRLFISGKKQIRWQNEDIRYALRIHSISSKCYRYLRKYVGIPLPSINTLCRHQQLNFIREPVILDLDTPIKGLSDTNHPIEGLSDTINPVKELSDSTIPQKGIDGTVTLFCGTAPETNGDS